MVSIQVKYMTNISLPYGPSIAGSPPFVSKNVLSYIHSI
jgi:hypothetical protein